ncbi:MAG: hypothetical protein PVF63_10225 [Gammaproteobacteria bacterium]
MIVPLALERQCLSGARAAESGPIVSISQSGQGADNAVRAARAAIEHGATALMSVGVAGALVSGISAGDVVIPDAVIDAASGSSFECSVSWSGAMRSQIDALGGVNSGTLLGVSEALLTPAQKEAAANRYGSIACDMESAAIAAIAQAAQIHFAALRVISDASSDELPPGVAGWVDSAGNARVRPVLGALMSPGQWRSIISMTARFRVAQRRLRQLSERLAVAGWCCPQS